MGYLGIRNVYDPKKSPRSSSASDAKEDQSVGNNTSDAGEETLREVPLVVKENYRTHSVTDLTESNIDEEITVSGWVNSVRDHGELVFIDLRDSSYQILQVRVNGSAVDNLADVSRLKPESVVTATGKLVKREEDDFNPSLKTGKLELDTSKLEILNLSKTLPFE